MHKTDAFATCLFDALLEYKEWFSRHAVQDPRTIILFYQNIMPEVYEKVKAHAPSSKIKEESRTFESCVQNYQYLVVQSGEKLCRDIDRDKMWNMQSEFLKYENCIKEIFRRSNLNGAKDTNTALEMFIIAVAFSMYDAWQNNKDEKTLRPINRRMISMSGRRLPQPRSRTPDSMELAKMANRTKGLSTSLGKYSRDKLQEFAKLPGTSVGKYSRNMLKELAELNTPAGKDARKLLEELAELDAGANIITPLENTDNVENLLLPSAAPANSTRAPNFVNLATRGLVRRGKPILYTVFAVIAGYLAFQYPKVLDDGLANIIRGLGNFKQTALERAELNADAAHELALIAANAAQNNTMEAFKTGSARVFEFGMTIHNETQNFMNRLNNTETARAFRGEPPRPTPIPEKIKNATIEICNHLDYLVDFVKAYEATTEFVDLKKMDELFKTITTDLNSIDQDLKKEEATSSNSTTAPPPTTTNSTTMPPPTTATNNSTNEKTRNKEPEALSIRDWVLANLIMKFQIAYFELLGVHKGGIVKRLTDNVISYLPEPTPLNALAACFIGLFLLRLRQVQGRKYDDSVGDEIRLFDTDFLGAAAFQGRNRLHLDELWNFYFRKAGIDAITETPIGPKMQHVWRVWISLYFAGLNTGILATVLLMAEAPWNTKIELDNLVKISEAAFNNSMNLGAEFMKSQTTPPRTSLQILTDFYSKSSYLELSALFVGTTSLPLLAAMIPASISIATVISAAGNASLFFWNENVTNTTERDRLMKAFQLQVATTFATTIIPAVVRLIAKFGGKTTKAFGTSVLALVDITPWPDVLGPRALFHLILAIDKRPKNPRDITNAPNVEVREYLRKGLENAILAKNETSEARKATAQGINTEVYNTNDKRRALLLIQQTYEKVHAEANKALSIPGEDSIELDEGVIKSATAMRNSILAILSEQFSGMKVVVQTNATSPVETIDVDYFEDSTYIKIFKLEENRIEFIQNCNRMITYVTHLKMRNMIANTRAILLDLIHLPVDMATQKSIWKTHIRIPPSPAAWNRVGGKMDMVARHAAQKVHKAKKTRRVTFLMLLKLAKYAGESGDLSKLRSTIASLSPREYLFAVWEIDAPEFADEWPQ